MDESSTKFDRVIVPKPWGHEYQIYSNNNVAIWHLHIRAGEGTSKHCHPNKKTGLMLVKGIAEIGFLNGVQKVEAPFKIVIHKGVWHRTKALTDVELLEIETPEDKEDIIRLEDYYGREGKPYEPKSSYIPSAIHNIELGDNKIGDCIIRPWKFYDYNLCLLEEYKYLMILNNGVSFNNYFVLGPGDIIDSKSFYQLAKKFTMVCPIETLGLCNA